jgi:hypothetical protein
LPIVCSLTDDGDRMADPQHTTTPPATGLPTCEAHGEPTRLTCVDCGKPICPKCSVRTEVGLKCHADARPAEVPKEALALLRPSRARLYVGLAGLVLAAAAVAFLALRPAEEEVLPSALPPVGTWTEIPGLATIRGTASVTPLPDGSLLVAGGGVGQIGLRAAELFDPPSGQWRATGELAEARRGHAAVALPDGRVLVAGGINEGILLASTEIYDPARGTWSPAAPMSVARVGHSLTVLADGRVLAAGGTIGEAPAPGGQAGGQPGGQAGGQASAAAQTITPDASAEIYDPAAGAWRPAEPMAAARYEHTATLLGDGRVLIAGGRGGSQPLATTELFDPAIGGFVGSTDLSEPRANHTAVRLADGSVLVAGGSGGPDGDLSLATAELFQPGQAGWTQVAPLTQGRTGHAATLLADGRVLVTAGESTARGSRRSLDTAEVFDPGQREWRSAGKMACPRSEQAAALLADGSVLVVAGDAAFPGQAPVAQGCADRYRP